MFRRFFFEICTKDGVIGFLGIREVLNKSSCEIEVFVFKIYRNNITKGIVLNVLDFPKELGFSKIIMTTSKKSVYNLLKSMGRYKVEYLFRHKNKDYFQRDIT